jgi:anthranilate synthase component I
VTDTSQDSFLRDADRSPIAVVSRKLFADSETPMGLYRKLETGPGSFLLESADQAGVWSRYSFIGASCWGVITEHEDKTAWHSLGLAEGDAFGADVPAAPLDAVAMLLDRWHTPDTDHTLPFPGGLVGYIGWEAVRHIEHLPHQPSLVHDVPWLSMALVRDLIIFDHHSSEVELATLVPRITTLTADDYEAAVSRLDHMQSQLTTPTSSLLSVRNDPDTIDVPANMTTEDFHQMVDRAKDHIRDGDVFQVVLSQRFDVTLEATPLEVYRVLRSLNPSPYMYLLESIGQDGKPFHVVGSSPEALVTVKNSRVYSHPIAGSRPRGKTPETDHLIAEELLADRKEQAEHLMLVDLARNDLSKVCQAGTVEVTQFMEVERFSHIMHLVSSVEGSLSPGKGPVDVFRATFPAGTLSGAPKPRALEIIDDLEPDQRGIYGGVVGYFGLNGDTDLAIAIRTIWLSGSVATVQAGAGIVADSVNTLEYQETHHKAAAPLRAVLSANALSRHGG